ncbi:TPA: conjugal transfer protein [Serratia liquefaciens]|nr:conjugal transfer protein [Serratia liquefaciens]
MSAHQRILAGSFGFSQPQLLNVSFRSTERQTPDSNPDACGAVLCLLGMTRDGDCDKYIQKYFSIKRYKHGHFSPSRTKAARGETVESCKDDEGLTKKANDIWGPVEHGF